MKHFFSTSLIVTIFSAVLLSCSNQSGADGLELQQGWVRALPPGKGMTAAYGELHNKSKDTIWLVAYDSEAFSYVSLHKTMIVDGVSRMREQTNVQIEPGEVLKLEPGGLHLMLMNPAFEIRPGDEIEIVISSDEQRFVFKLPVEAR